MKNVFDRVLVCSSERGYGVQPSRMQGTGAHTIQSCQTAEIDELTPNTELKAILELSKQQLQVQPAQAMAEDCYHASEGTGCLLEALEHA